MALSLPSGVGEDTSPSRNIGQRDTVNSLQNGSLVGAGRCRGEYAAPRRKGGPGYRARGSRDWRITYAGIVTL